MRVTRFVLAGLFFTSATAMALPGIPNGTYSGEGKMRTGIAPAIPYTATLTLSDAQIVADYVYATGATVTYTADIVQTTGNSFEVKKGDETIGSGYCEEFMCHLDIPGHDAEETIVFHKNELLRIGSMQHGAVKLTYSETLIPE